MIVSASLSVVARTFFQIQSVIRHCTLFGLWTLIELEGISVGRDQIPFFYQLAKLIVIGRAGHSNGLSDGFWREGECIVVSVGSKIQIESQGVWA